MAMKQPPEWKVCENPWHYEDLLVWGWCGECAKKELEDAHEKAIEMEINVIREK